MELWRPPHGLVLSGPFAGTFGCAVAIAIAIVNPNSIIGVVIAAFAIALAWVGGTIVSASVALGLLSLSQRGFRARWQVAYLFSFLAAMILFCLWMARLLSPLGESGYHTFPGIAHASQRAF
jgi:hypothetical protein